MPGTMIKNKSKAAKSSTYIFDDKIIYKTPVPPQHTLELDWVFVDATVSDTAHELFP